MSTQAHFRLSGLFCFWTLWTYFSDILSWLEISYLNIGLYSCLLCCTFYFSDIIPFCWKSFQNQVCHGQCLKPYTQIKFFFSLYKKVKKVEGVFLSQWVTWSLVFDACWFEFWKASMLVVTVLLKVVINVLLSSCIPVFWVSILRISKKLTWSTSAKAMYPPLSASENVDLDPVKYCISYSFVHS